MDTDLIIVGSTAAVVLVTLYLRTNIALGIFSLGIGYVLADLTTASVVSTLYRFGLSGGGWPLDSMVSITLTLLPALLILFRFRRFQSGRFFEHIFPAIFLSLLMAVLVMVQLPLNSQDSLADRSYVFDQFQYFRTAIVIGAAFIAMFDLMVHEQKLRRKAKRGKRTD